MKNLLAISAVCIGLFGTTSCADLGFGVDYNATAGPDTYWYPSGYPYDNYWNNPLWDYGPIYRPPRPAPPLVGNGPGSIVIPGNRPSQTPRPPQISRPPQVRPPQQRPTETKPLGPNGIGWNPGPNVRPGTIPRDNPSK